jgi:hypothetical protein
MAYNWNYPSTRASVAVGGWASCMPWRSMLMMKLRWEWLNEAYVGVGDCGVGEMMVGVEGGYTERVEEVVAVTQKARSEEMT